MSVVRVIFYSETAVASTDVKRFIVGDVVRKWAMPNDENVIRIESFAHSKQLQLKSSANVLFSILVNMNNNDRIKALTRIRFNGLYIIIDKSWLISEDKVVHRVPKEPVHLPIDFLTIEINGNDLQNIERARFDVQLNDGHFAAEFFSNERILFARFNGNYVMNRYSLLINRAARNIVRQRAEMALADVAEQNVQQIVIDENAAENAIFENVVERIVNDENTAENAIVENIDQQIVIDEKAEEEKAKDVLVIDVNVEAEAATIDKQDN